MSPEQAEGRKVDARSDIFSFGSLLYEMLTGRRDFAGASGVSVLAKIVNEDPLPPSQLAAAVPPELEKTVLRCLRKDPARRYQTMADLKVALEDLAEDTSVSQQAVRPKESPPARWKWGLAAIAIPALGAIYFVSRTAPPSVGEPMHAVPVTAVSGQVRYPTLSPESDRVAFTWTGAAQDNTDVSAQQMGAGSPLRLTTDPANDSSPAWSPDGRWIAFLRRRSNSPRHEVRLVPPLGGPERKIAEVAPRNPIYRTIALAWCPDSSCLIVPDAQREGGADALFVIALDSPDRRQMTFPPREAMIDTDPAIAPDGLSLVFRRDFTPFTGEMYRSPLAPGLIPAGEPSRSPDRTLSATRPAWMPDSREIVFAARGSLWRVDAFGGGVPTRLPFVGLDGFAPAISRPRSDGHLRLAYMRVFADTNVWRINLTTAGLPAVSPAQKAISSTRADHLPMLSPDGTRIAFFSSRSGEFELWVGDPDGSNAVQLTSLNAIPGWARWSPDGATLTFHSDPEGHPDVLTIPAAGGRPKVLMPGPVGGGYPSFSRDGRWVYFAGPNAAGDMRVQKIPASGGVAVEVTRTAGVVPIEWFTTAAICTIWRLP